MSTSNTGMPGKGLIFAIIGIVILVFLYKYLTLWPTLFLGALAAMYIYKYTKKKPEYGGGSSTDHGSASWATREQFIAKGYGGTTGLWIGDGIMREKQGHLITVAGSREGKGTSIIIPNLLIKPFGSYVITDPKGENACITARRQQEMGQKVYILDPWEVQTTIGAKHGIRTSGFNPFDFIKYDMSELQSTCLMVANFLVPDKPDSKDPFWDDKGRGLIKTLLMHIVTGRPATEHNFWTLYKMLRLSGAKWMELLLEMQDNETGDGLVSIAAGEFIGMDEAGSTMTGIKATAQNATTIFESPQLRKSLESSDFNPYDLPNGNCTVYVVVPEKFIDISPTWLRLVIGLSLKACNARPNKRVNFFMDEFAIMGKMKDVQNGFAFAAGQNIAIWAFVQSLSQLKELYGEDGMNTMISNAGVLQVFGVKDQFTTEYVSKRLGKTTYKKETRTTNYSQQGNGTSVGIQTYERDLMTPEEVEKYNGIIIFTEGLKYRIYKSHYYSNRFKGLSGNEDWLTPEQKKMIKSGKTPQDWGETFQALADPRPREYA